MTMSEWAENEINILIKENADPEKSCSYYIECAKSALKVFKVLCEEGNSGMSVKLTQDILSQLIDGMPLTPIEDTPDIWIPAPEIAGNGVKVYQCTRKFSLFKYIDSNDSVNYSDVDRVILKSVDDESTFYNGSIARLVDDMYPITMPYIPTKKPFTIYVKDFLADPTGEDYDTRGLLWITTPYGERVEIGRYFKDGENGMVEIDKAEYDERKKEAMKNAK